MFIAEVIRRTRRQIKKSNQPKLITLFEQKCYTANTYIKYSISALEKQVKKGFHDPFNHLLMVLLLGHLKNKKTGGADMPYIYARTKAGRTILIEKYYSSRYHKKGIKRSENHKKTSEEQEKVNLRKDIRRLTLQLNENFQYGDYHLVLSYAPDHRPATPEEAKRDREKFLRRLRKQYKKNESELKYIIVTEFGKKGALHHHLVINAGVPTRQIQDCWELGRCHFNPMEKSGEYSKLAAYLLKNRAYWKKHGGKGKQCSCSRNIVFPSDSKRNHMLLQWLLRKATGTERLLCSP